MTAPPPPLVAPENRYDDVSRLTPVWEPSVAVVIPVYNRAEELACTLAGLAGQTVGSDQFEVVPTAPGKACTRTRAGISCTGGGARATPGISHRTPSRRKPCLGGTVGTPSVPRPDPARVRPPSHSKANSVVNTNRVVGVRDRKTRAWFGDRSPYFGEKNDVGSPSTFPLRSFRLTADPCLMRRRFPA